MKSAKPLVILGAVLIGLIAVALFFINREAPTPEPGPALGDVRQDKVSRIEIASSVSQVVLEKKDGQWQLISPITDRANMMLVGPLINTFSTFTLGTVVSEDPSRYERYEVMGSSAAHIKMFVQGTEKPILDAWLGKGGIDFRTCYMRFEGKKEVYSASGVNSWALKVSTSDLRDSNVLPVDMSTLQQIDAQVGDKTYTVVRSSDVWKNPISGSNVAPEWVEILVGHISDLKSEEFIDQVPQQLKTGIDKPVLSIKVKAEKEHTAHFGLKAKAPGNPNDMRFARAEDRNPLLLVPDKPIDDILKLLKTLP